MTAMKITKLMIALIRPPMSTNVFALPLRSSQPRPILLPDTVAASSGLMMKPMNWVIRVLNASATTKATATSTMLPRMTKFLKPLIMKNPLGPDRRQRDCVSPVVPRASPPEARCTRCIMTAALAAGKDHGRPSRSDRRSRRRLPGREGHPPGLVGLPIDLQHPGKTASGRQLQHGVEGDRDVDLGPRRHPRRPPRLDLAAGLDGRFARRVAAGVRAAVLVQQPEHERRPLVGLLPGDVNEQRDAARDRTGPGQRPAPARDEQLAVRYLGMVGEQHGHSHD